jgi:hypothetical protein
MPTVTDAFFSQLNLTEEEKKKPTFSWGFFISGRTLNQPEPVFPRK